MCCSAAGGEKKVERKKKCQWTAATKSTSHFDRVSLLVRPNFSPSFNLPNAVWNWEDCSKQNKTGTSRQPVRISANLNKSKSCYVSGQNIASFPQCDESAVRHQSFMSLRFLSYVKVFCGSLLQPHGCLLDLKERTESSLDWKRGHHKAWRGARPEYVSGLAGLAVMASADDDESMTKVPLAWKNKGRGCE